MQWSIRMGKILGINFRIHVTFLLLLLFIFFSALPQRGLKGATVSEIMDRDFLSVSPETPLDRVYSRLRSRNKSSMLVTEGEQVKGMLCLDGISRYLMIQAALKKAGQEA